MGFDTSADPKIIRPKGLLTIPLAKIQKSARCHDCAQNASRPQPSDVDDSGRTLVGRRGFALAVA